MSDAYVSFAKARLINSEKTEAIANAANAWQATVTEPDAPTYQSASGSDIRLEGFAGSVELVVSLDASGQPLYDKLIYAQKPGVVIVAWGRDADGTVRIPVLTQERPFAENPDEPEEQRPLLFGQVPMGFFKPQPGQSTDDAIKDAAQRELREETGVTDIIRIEIPRPRVYWQDPTFMKNGTYVAFAEVALRPMAPETGHRDGERIRSVELLTVPELLARIAQGCTPAGVHYHMGVSLGPVLMFFARHPECLKESL